MFSRFMKAGRAVWFSIALLIVGGGPAWAQASQCASWAQGGQTGKTYKLKSQSLVTETQTVQLSLGGLACGVGGGTSGTVSEQYNVGYYQAEGEDSMAKVDCRTGKIIGWT